MEGTTRGELEEGVPDAGNRRDFSCKRPVFGLSLVVVVRSVLEMHPEID